MSDIPIGFKIIKEMTREELITEIVDNQRAQAEAMDNSRLRHIVADFRITEMTKRIHTEAGFKSIPGLLGGVVAEDDEDGEDS